MRAENGFEIRPKAVKSQAIKKVAEKSLKPTLTDSGFQQHSTTFSAAGPILRPLFGGAGGI